MLLKIVARVLGLTFIVAPLVVTPQVIDTALFVRGQQLYRDHCALCHKDSGAGQPPDFPALSGNARLSDPVGIVNTIRHRTGNMPPFPDLSAAEISSLANYVRNAWVNEYGGVTTEEVAAVLDGLEQIGQTMSAWDGVFTDAQAERGQAVYPGVLAVRVTAATWTVLQRIPICAQRPLWHGRSSSATGMENRLPLCSNTLGRRCRKTIRAF